MTPLARTLRVLPHAAQSSRPRPRALFCTSGRARLVRLGVIILVVITGAAALPIIFRQARGRRRARCETPAGRQRRWPARLRRAAGRTDPLLLSTTLVLVGATLVLVVLAFLTLLAVDRSAGSAGKAPTAPVAVPGGSSSVCAPGSPTDRRRIGETARCRRQLSRSIRACPAVENTSCIFCGATRSWVTGMIGAGSQITRVSRLRPGSWHVNHAVDVIDGPGRAHRVVLRRWARPGRQDDDPDYTVGREAGVPRCCA
jgi:hypothetical protein